MDVHSQATQPAQLHALQNGVAVLPIATEYLAFRLGQQEYAVEISDVQEIRNFERPNRMLGAAPHIIGVLNLRSEIVPIVDMRIRLGLTADVDQHTVIIVMNLLFGTVGVVVDSVSDVLPLALEDIQYLPQLNDSNEVRLFQGLGSSHQSGVERTLIVMNFQDVLPRVPLNSMPQPTPVPKLSSSSNHAI